MGGADELVMWVGDDLYGDVNFAEYCFALKCAKLYKGHIKPFLVV
jgi:hypothetical protein